MLAHPYRLSGKQETERMMAFIDNLVARCKDEHQRMQKLLEWMKSGKAKSSTMSPGTGLVDTTPADIEHYTRKIAELDALIARHPEAK
jgi:hypothetical protein